MTILSEKYGIIHINVLLYQNIYLYGKISYHAYLRGYARFNYIYRLSSLLGIKCMHKFDSVYKISLVKPNSYTQC